MVYKLVASLKLDVFKLKKFARFIFVGKGKYSVRHSCTGRTHGLNSS
jgi:hypothetical protein